MPRAASRTSSGTPVSPARKLRSRITREYAARPTSTVVADRPVNGSRNANIASDRGAERARGGRRARGQQRLRGALWVTPPLPRGGGGAPQGGKPGGPAGP